MAKKKRSWKKKLGKALMAGAALAGGLALAKRGRGTPYRNVHETGAITQTPGRETWDPGAGSDYHTPRVRNPLASPKWDNWHASYMPLKKGGRVGVGKAKRGFGRALKKGK